MNTQRQINPFGFIAEFEGNVIDFLNEGLLLPETKLPTLPLRDMVIYPGVIMPVSVARQTSQDVLRKALDERQLIGTVTQLRPEQNELDSTSFHRVGVAARVLKILDMPDGTLTAFVQGYTAFNVSRVSKDTRTVVARRRHESLPPPEDSFYRIIRETLAERVSEYIQLSDFIADEDVTLDTGLFVASIVNDAQVEELRAELQAKIAETEQAKDDYQTAAQHLVDVAGQLEQGGFISFVELNQ